MKQLKPPTSLFSLNALTALFSWKLSREINKMGHLGTILVHSARRQNFAGMLFKELYKIRHLVILEGIPCNTKQHHDKTDTASSTPFI